MAISAFVQQIRSYKAKPAEISIIVSSSRPTTTKDENIR